MPPRRQWGNTAPDSPYSRALPGTPSRPIFASGDMARAISPMVAQPNHQARPASDPSVPMILPSTPSFRLDGKRALVTGASRGIGLAAASALAQAGAHVVLAARDADHLDEAARSIMSAGGKAEMLVIDVTDQQATAE